MNLILAVIIGALLTVMVMINSALSVLSGQTISVFFVHLTGFLTISLIIPFSKRKTTVLKGEKIPFYLYTGGVLGVVIVFSNNICFEALGASLMIASCMAGQTIGAMVIDTTGFLGVKKYPLDLRKIIGIIIMFIGIAVMVDQWKLNILYTLISIATGGFIVLNMIINALLGSKIGSPKGIRVNYVSGFITLLFIFPFIGLDYNKPFSEIASISPIYLFGGGILGVLIITCLNIVMPKIPTVYSAMLIFFGQVVAGLVIDYFKYDIFSLKKLSGAVIVLTGILFNIIIEYRKPECYKSSSL